jgi:hypothetical protein
MRILADESCYQTASRPPFPPACPPAFRPAFVGAMIGVPITAQCKLPHDPPDREGPHDQDDQHVQGAVSRNRLHLLRGVL